MTPSGRTIPSTSEAKQNGYRQSYCTYKVTCFGNMASVADEMGKQHPDDSEALLQADEEKGCGTLLKLTPEYVDFVCQFC